MEKLDLFARNLRSARLHPNFVALRDSPLHANARRAMNTIFERMGDPNGNFQRNFPGNGFHARVFELALFAYLDTAGFKIDRAYERPDFLATRNGVTIAIEATTSNPPDGADRDISVFRLQNIPGHELIQKVRVEFPKRIISSLRKKVSHRYDQLHHCRGKPLILVVAPFFEPGAIFYTDEGLVEYLYGPRVAPESSEDEPFFAQKSSEAVSAVLFCNQLTVPKFFRLSSLFPSPGMTVIREGVCYRDMNDEDFCIEKYEHLLGEASIPVETWHEGVTLFLNPWARTPLDPELCPHTSKLWIDNGHLRRDVSPFHPVTSFMRIHNADEALASSGLLPTGYARG